MSKYNEYKMKANRYDALIDEILNDNHYVMNFSFCRYGCEHTVIIDKKNSVVKIRSLDLKTGEETKLTGR